MIFGELQENIQNCFTSKINLDGDGEEDHYDLDDDGDGFSDEEEITYPSDPRDPNSLANVARIPWLNNAEVLRMSLMSIVGIFEGTDLRRTTYIYPEQLCILHYRE